jgi:hypothetical protein
MLKLPRRKLHEGYSKQGSICRGLYTGSSMQRVLSRQLYEKYSTKGASCRRFYAEGSTQGALSMQRVQRREFFAESTVLPGF